MLLVIKFLLIFDFVKLGAMQFTLTFGESSEAKARVNPSTAPLDAEMIV